MFFAGKGLYMTYAGWQARIYWEVHQNFTLSKVGGIFTFSWNYSSLGPEKWGNSPKVMKPKNMGIYLTNKELGLGPKIGPVAGILKRLPKTTIF